MRHGDISDGAFRACVWQVRLSELVLGPSSTIGWTAERDGSLYWRGQLTVNDEHLKPIVGIGAQASRVRQYAELFKNGSPFPAITALLYRDGTIAVEDGWHRVCAARQAGCASIDAEVAERVGPPPNERTLYTHRDLVVRALQAGRCVPGMVRQEYGL